MFYPPPHRVRLLPLQGKEEEQQTTVGSGKKLLELYELYNRHSPSLRTFVASLLLSKDWYSVHCSLIWKVMDTNCKHFVFQLAPSAHGIDEIDFGLLLTPAATNIGNRSDEAIQRRKEYRKKTGHNTSPAGSLLEQIKIMIPTIGASEPKGASSKRYRNSAAYRGAKTAEYMRTSKDDPIYLHPSFAEAMMGFPMGWSELKDTVMQ